MDEYKIGDISSILNSVSTPQNAAETNGLFSSKPQTAVPVEDIYVKPDTSLAKAGKRPKKRKTVVPADEPELELPVFPQLSAEEQLAVDKRTIFIGNLPVGLKRKQLRKIFDEFGKIESLRFRSVAISDLKLGRKVCLKSNKINENAISKNAYVVFKAEESVAQSLKKNGLEVKEHHIRVDKLVKSKDEVDNDSKNSVFIGNIAFAATEEDIRNALVQCGDIEYVRLLRDPKTNIGKGFGYVKFVDSSGVMLAMKVKDTVEINGRKLRIQKCKSKVALEHKKKARESKNKKEVAKNSTFRGRKSKDSDKDNKKEAAKNTTFRGRKSKDSDKEIFTVQKKSKSQNKNLNPASRPKVKKQRTMSKKVYDKKVNKESKKSNQGTAVSKNSKKR